VPGNGEHATDVFNALVGDLDYPMFIATARSGEELGGCLVGFATQCSIAPPRFLICVSEKNRTFRIASRARLLIVHFLPADAGDLAELFGGQTGDDTDKFSLCEWRPGPGDTPVLSRCQNWFAGDVLERVSLGDHAGFLLAPVDGAKQRDAHEFTFHRAKRIEPGHEAT